MGIKRKREAPDPSPLTRLERWALRRCTLLLLYRVELDLDVEADLLESFQRRLRRSGRRTAHLGFWMDLWSLFRHRNAHFSAPPSHPMYTAMFTNYLRVAWRYLRRHRGYSALNLLGFSAGIACCLLIVLFLQHELSYDRHHEKADRIYRVVGGMATDDQPFKRTYAYVPMPVGPTMADEFPEVQQAGRFQPYFQGFTSGKALFHYGDKHLYEKIFWADAAIFDIFDIPFLEGDPQTAFRNQGAMVISAAAATRFFGDTNAVGKVLTMEGTAYTITGVFEDIQDPSHIHFDVLITLEGFNENRLNNWFGFQSWTYLLLHEDASVASLEEKLAAFADRHARANSGTYNFRLRFELQPLTDIHLHSHLNAELEANGNVTLVYILGFVALFTLLLTCINFINFTTARSARRAVEVGMRKVLGAHHTQLIRQFLVESILATVLAFALGVVLAWLALPAFNTLAGTHLTLHLFEQQQLFLILAGTSVLVGVLAGSYPAFFLSAFKPIRVLKGGLIQGRNRSLLHDGFVVVQWAASIILIIGSGMMIRQLDHMHTMDLGFDQEHMLVLPLKERATRSQHAVLKDALLAEAQVLAATSASTSLGRDAPGRLIRRAAQAESENQGIKRILTDYDFISTMGIEHVAGRDFSRDIPTDASEAFVLNETALADLGWSTPAEALGQELILDLNRRGRVIGVVEDFHYRSVQHAVEPVILALNPSSLADYVIVKLHPDGIAPTLATAKQIWTTQFPDQPFDYFFVDEDLASLYQTEEQLSRVLTAFAGFNIFLACLGLFAVAVNMIERRMKEIGIRKILGASVLQILLLLSGRLLKLVLVAFALGGPLAYLATRLQLQHFPYQAEMSLWLFLGAGLLVLGVATLTVFFQALKAALAVPVQTLRTE